MSDPSPLHVLYDARCGFCTAWIRRFVRLDRRHALVLHDLNDAAAIAQEFPSVDVTDLANAMYAVTPDGRAYRGYFAVRRILLELPLLWVLLPLFWFPGVPFVGTRVYAWVARNRRDLGCGAGGACTLHPGKG